MVINMKENEYMKAAISHMSKKGVSVQEVKTLGYETSKSELVGMSFRLLTDNETNGVQINDVKVTNHLCVNALRFECSFSESHKFESQIKFYWGVNK